MKKEPKWLPELDGTVPEEAYGYAITLYSITYEAWRRGLNIAFENIYHNKGKFVPVYTISDKHNRVKFRHSRPDTVSEKAINTCSNKQLTREALAENNVPVPKGVLLESLDPDQIEKEITNLSFPLVVKPVAGHGGRGVITGIDDFKELMENVEYLNGRLNYSQIIVEEYIDGEDYRAFVIGDKVVGAFRRLPPHVIGDGKKNIRRLLKEKNEKRVKIPGTYNLKIHINEEMRRELKKNNLTFKSVPEEGQFVRLKTKNNVSSGGDPIDGTEELTDDLKKNLVKAVEAIPGLIQGGVDVIYDKNLGRYAILEINTKPSIRNHLYPLLGNAHEIPKAMIDYYFPETKGKYLSDKTPKYFFDYSVVKDHIQNNRLKTLSLPSHPNEPNLISKLITFESDKDIKILKRMIRRNFHSLKFNGDMNYLGEKKYQLILAGNYQDVEYFFNILKSKTYITNLNYEDYSGGVRIGITVNQTLDAQISREAKEEFSRKLEKEKRKLEKERRKLEKELNTLEMEADKQSEKFDQEMYRLKEESDRNVRELEEEINNLKKSKSWIITAPIRKIRKKFSN